MILLKATAETLRLTTSAVGCTIDYSVSYADITTTTFGPSTSEGKIVSNTVTPILASPAGSTQRQVKLITISNIHATVACDVTVDKYDTGSTTSWRLSTITTLLAGETLQYMDGQGWLLYSSVGEVKSTQSLRAVGSDTQVQFNSSGFLAGHADLVYDTSTSHLKIGASSSNGGISLTSNTNDEAPVAGELVLYSKIVAGGRHMLKQIGPAGIDTALQPFFGRNNVAIWKASGGSTTNSGLGLTLTLTGTGTVAATATTNVYTWMQKLEILVTVAATTAVAGWRTAGTNFGLGNSAKRGGFHYVCRFGPSTGVTGLATRRLFVGFAANAAAPTDVDPSTQVNIIGVGYDNGDTNFSIMHNDGSGTATKVDLGASFPKTTTDRTYMYDLAFFCAPNTSTVYYEFIELTSDTVVSGTITTNLPSNTTLLGARGYSSVGGTSSVTGIALVSLYVETDY